MDKPLVKPDTRICAPGNLKGSRTSPATATLTWDEPYALCHLCPDAVSYELSGSSFATLQVCRPPCEVKFNYPEARARVLVRAKGANGSMSRPTVVELEASPHAPTDLRASDCTDNGFTMGWKAPVGGVPAFDYLVFHNGEVIATVSGINYRMTSAATPTDVYAVRARSNAGNLSDPVILDITPPEKPTGLYALELSSRAVVLIWAATSDNVKVVAYEILEDAVVIDKTKDATPAYAVVGLIPETRYTFTVRALDASGNRSVASDPLSIRTPVLDPPQNVRVLNVTSSSIELTWNRPEGAIGLLGYKSEADNHKGSSRLIQSVLQIATFTGLQSSSTYTIKVSAHDASQQYSQSVTFQVTTL